MSVDPNRRSKRLTIRSMLAIVFASFGSDTSSFTRATAAAVSSGILCSAGLASVFFSSALVARISASSATASSDSFLACTASSVVSSLPSVVSTRRWNDLVSSAPTRSLVVTSSRLRFAIVCSKSTFCSFSMMLSAAFTIAVTVDGALGMYGLRGVQLIGSTGGAGSSQSISR